MSDLDKAKTTIGFAKDCCTLFGGNSYDSRLALILLGYPFDLIKASLGYPSSSLSDVLEDYRTGLLNHADMQYPDI